LAQICQKLLGKFGMLQMCQRHHDLLTRFSNHKKCMPASERCCALLCQRI
jgi:hypothetical protein